MGRNGEGCQVVLSNVRRVYQKYCNCNLPKLFSKYLLKLLYVFVKVKGWEERGELPDGFVQCEAK